MKWLERSRCGLVVLLLLAGAQAQAGTLVVAAAISLREALQGVVADYESTHPGERVELDLAATGTLLQQLRAGAPIDLFLSADETSMDQAAAAGLILRQTRRDFAGNTLVLIVPRRAPPLPGDGRRCALVGVSRLAIGDERSVPAGRYAQRLLEQRGCWSALQTRLIRAENVRQVLDEVARGEVDAGFVYASDTRIDADRIRVVRAYALQPPIRYPLALVSASTHAAAARAFIGLLLARAGQASLQRQGFIVPGDAAWSR